MINNNKYNKKSKLVKEYLFLHSIKEDKIFPLKIILLFLKKKNTYLEL